MPGEKTEKATPKRKQDERKKGNVFQSNEVGTLLSLLAVFFSLQLLGPWIVSNIESTMKDFIALSGTKNVLTMTDVNEFGRRICLCFAVTILPVLVIGAFASCVSTIAQTRGLVSFEALKPKFNRMNPIQGIKKLFSLRGLVELLKSMLKIVILGIVIWQQLRGQIPLIPRLMEMSIVQAGVAIGAAVMEIVKKVALIMAFVAAFDYLYQWYEYEKNLRMSKQEIKEEYKQTEGDPQVKGKIREKQNMMARRRMMQNVPNADVVIRNPTHYAVALQYDPAHHRAPVVIAKGQDSLALRIVAVAEEHDIVVTENRPLARGLYENVELNAEIPDRFYQPVAEVLAFVYNLKKKDLT